MIKNCKRIIIVLTVFMIFVFSGNSFAHSGRTDSSGGHKDNNNKSGLGSYHYHCGGYPAHLHPNGVCPYASNSSSKDKKSSSSVTKSNKQSTSSTVEKPKKVEVSSIQINEVITSMEIGDSRVLTATVQPSNATDKSIIWKSSDPSIADINNDGVIKAIKSGHVVITVSSSNGIDSSISVLVKEEERKEGNTSLNEKNKNYMTVNSNSTNDSYEKDDLAGSIVTVGLLGCAGGYLGYKKYKNKKE